MTFIVKVQRSITTDAPREQMLIYNQDRTVMYQADLTDEVRKLMGGQLKVYAIATLDGKKRIHIRRLIKSQKW